MKKATAAIKANIARASIKAGQHLLTVKEQLAHGQFRAWLKSEFNLSPRTAERYMQAARLAAKNATVSQLKPTALYALAAPSMPQDVQRQVISKLEKGELVDKKKILQMLREKDMVDSKVNKSSSTGSNRERYSATEESRPSEAACPGNNLPVQNRSEHAPLFRMKAEIGKKVMRHLPPADQQYFWARIHRMDDHLIIVELSKRQPTRWHLINRLSTTSRAGLGSPTPLQSPGTSLTAA